MEKKGKKEGGKKKEGKIPYTYRISAPPSLFLCFWVRETLRGGAGMQIPEEGK